LQAVTNKQEEEKDNNWRQQDKKSLDFTEQNYLGAREEQF
jgi:hypothetical protein